MTADDRQDDGVRERLARVIAHYEDPDGDGGDYRDTADAILADPGLVVLRAEDVEQVGTRDHFGVLWQRDEYEQDPDEPVYRIEGWPR